MTRFYVYERLYFFSENGALYQIGLLYHKQKKFKLNIPFCCGKRNYYPFWPDNFQRIFYNSEYIDQAEVIILTDDVACAGHFQAQLSRLGIFDIAWISWYGDLKLYPWERLKEKHVYYFMEKHSGLNDEQILEKANMVQQQLRSVDGPELSLIFMNSVEFPGTFSRKENIPQIVSLEKWMHWTMIRNAQQNNLFGYFRHQVSPRPNRLSRFDITPFIVHGNRILITGSGSSKELFLLALLVPFCRPIKPIYQMGTSDCQIATPCQKGTVLFIRRDQGPLDDWIDAMQLNHELNIRKFYFSELPTNFSDAHPLLWDEPINVSELKTSSIPDCQNLLCLIGQSAQVIKSEMPKILVIDSLTSFLIKVPKWTLALFDALRANGWTIILIESRRNPYAKTFHCEQVIVVEPSPVCTGNEVICSAEIPIYGKIKKFYKINLTDSSSPILREASYNRKSPGLLRSRKELVEELKKLFQAGFKGKEIAERLEISESMVKKLKRDCKLSQSRGRPIGKIIPSMTE